LLTNHKSFVFKFEDIEVREREFMLLKGGHAQAVEPKAFRVLLFLLRNPRRLVTKEEILNAVWSDSAVTDNSLTRSIATLRKLLGDDSREPRFIATVPTVGYRFLCNVVATEESANGFDAKSSNPPSEPATEAAPQIEEDAAPPPARDGKRLSGNGLSGSTVKLLLVGLCILILGTIAVELLVRRAGAKRDARGDAAAHLAIESRITSSSPEAPVQDAIVSHDGKYLAYFDNGVLYFRQIDSGETRALGLPKDFIPWPDDWFPDNTHLLVTQEEVPLETASLWKISVLGGSPVKLMDNAAGASVSPDGSLIAYRPGPNFGDELWVMNSDGSNAHRVAVAEKPDQLSGGEGWIQHIGWSPDGTRLAYVEAHLAMTHADPEQFANSLLTRNVNGGDLQVLLKDDPRLRMALCWTADGRILYSYLNNPASEREDAGVNSIQVDERTGKAIGPPQQITKGQGSIGGLSTTSDGKRLVISRGNTERQVFITESVAGARRWKTPRRLTLDTNESLATAWTSDSKAVLFISDRNGTWKLFKQNIDETTAEVLVEGSQMRFPRLSADGSQVLYLLESGDLSLPASLMSKPLAGGPPRLVLRDYGINNYQCARSPSQLCVFSKLVGPDHVLFSFDLEHGAGREIAKIPNGESNWTLSPDGSRIAMSSGRHQIRFLSPDTGAVHDVSLNDWPIFNVDWSSDSKGVFIRSVTPKGAPVILAFNEAGNVEVAIEGHADSYFSFFIQSPNGRYGILEMPTPGDNNAWMVENY
jgi:DNA-binding winged helix-turn-helix (wHTH) protein/Tol biopolymer transport system component